MIAWILIGMLSLGVVVSIQEKRPQRPVTENVTFSFNEGFPSFSGDSLKLMSFGYPRVLSNLFWLRFLQHTPPKRVEEDSVSWIYLDLDAISTLDPEFLPVFTSGAIFLSVVTTDKKGADLLLKKGAALYPENWRILGNLAYHQQFELGDPISAADTYFKAAVLPGAPHLFSILGASLRAKQGDKLNSIKILEQMRDESKDKVFRERLQSRIDLWKSELKQERKK